MEVLQVKEDAVKRGSLDLNELIIKHPAATFFLRAGGTVEQEGEGEGGGRGEAIHAGDILVVDRSLKPVNGKIVVVVSRGELVLRKCILFEERLHFIFLDPRKKMTKSESCDSNIQIFGIVTYIIKKC